MRFEKGNIVMPEEASFPEGALVVDGYGNSGQLLAHRMGGGLQLVIPAQHESRFRLVTEEERQATLFHSGTFALAETEKAFSGWTSGELWNGWEKPRFGFETCNDILTWMNDAKARYDQECDAFITLNQDGEQEVWAAEEITITDGSRIKVYPIGAGCWVWEAT